jgi:hypothetical protein
MGRIFSGGGLTLNAVIGGLGATDNRALRSDGTGGQSAQGSDVVIDDSGNIGTNALTPTHSLTIPATGTGFAHYNVASADRTVHSWVANEYVIATEANGGSARGLRLKTGAYEALLEPSGTTGLSLTGNSSNQFQIRHVTANVGLYLRGAISTTSAAPAVQLGNTTSFSATNVVQTVGSVVGTMNQTSTAGYKGLQVNVTETATGSGQKDLLSLEVGGAMRSRFDRTGHAFFDTTVTAGGTTGNQTIDKPTGTVNIAASGTTVTVTNATCATTSSVVAVIRTNDATAQIKNVVPGAGSFVINIVACTNEVSIFFMVIN